MGYLLGIEGGATRTTVLLADDNHEVIDHFAAGPANLRLMSSEDLEAHLRGIRRRLPFLPDAVGIGLAGARLEEDLEALRSVVARVWPSVPCAASDDLLTALEACDWDESCEVQVLVLSGTGSCCLGRRRDGSQVKFGGRGHILGDRASACHIAQSALRELMSIWDAENIWPDLGADILAALQLKDPEALIDWSLMASKTELASVAVPVFQAAKSRNDEIARTVLSRAAEMLAKDAGITARRMGVTEDIHVQFVFNGAVLLKNLEFGAEVGRLLKSVFPKAEVLPLARPSVWGAVNLAGALLSAGQNEQQERHEPVADPETLAALWRPEETSPTEARNPRSTGFSDMTVRQGIELMLSEDAMVPSAVLEAIDPISWTVAQVVEAFEHGGRLLYAGAGTSGRLGVLDASECPPTFRVPATQVQGIIAGGRSALWSASEGAEDNAEAGRMAIEHRNVTEQDVVIAISASGYAPFVWGCLSEAKRRGAKAVLLTCHPGYLKHPLPDRVIAINTGPEVLTGSTRLKAGTGTKLVLNIITTLSMAHTGKVTSNLMTDLNPSNIKLRDRAVRIVSEITGVDQETSRQTLRSVGWVVKAACEKLKE